MSGHIEAIGADTGGLPFQLTALLGRGGFGAVWEVERGAAGRAAVKLLHRVSEKTQQHFFMEARAVARLQHPNIVRIFDFGALSVPLQAGGDVFEAGSSYLMTALGRMNLRAFRALSGEEVRRLLLEILAALAHAHARGIIHRDIKPANILASTSAGPPWLLADFGTAHALDIEREDDRWAGVGTPRYMAPEQIRRQLHRQGPWTDLFALGCMAQELALGRSAHEGLDLRAVLSAQLAAAHVALEGVAPDYRAWLLRMLAADPRDRFQSAAAAARALRAVAVLPAQGTASEPSDETWTGTMGDLGLSSEAASVLPASAPRQVTAPMGVPPLWQEPMPTLAPTGLGVGVLHVRDIGVLGRQAEQEQMWGALRLAVRRRRPQAILLRGPAGIGKSRLARWLAEQAHEELGADIVSVTAADLGGLSSAILAAALRCSGLTGLARERQLQDRLAPLVGLTGESREAIRACLTGEVSGDARALLLELLEVRSRARPTVLVLDDAHGTAAPALAEALVAGGGAVVVILAVQDEAAAGAPAAAAAIAALGRREEAVTELALRPLSLEAQRSLLRAKVGLEEHDALRLADRTAGNPRYAEQLLQAWLAEGRLELGPDGSRIKSPGREDRALPAFAAVWADRIEQVLSPLPPEQRHHIERAAVLGMTVERAEWARACGPAEPGEALGRHMEAALVWCREGPERVRFVHAQLREALLDRARRGQRLAGHHRAAVGAIDEGGPHAAYRIAHHLLGAGEVDEALRRMSGVTRSQPSWHQGEVLLEGIQHALESAGTPPHDLRWGEAGFYRVRFLIIAHRRTEAQALLRQLEADAATHGWAPLEPQLLLLQARLARRMNQPEEAIEANRRLRALYLRRGEPASAADCEASIGRILLEEGRREEAMVILEQARARVGLSGDKLLESLAIAYTRLERFDEAEEVMARWEALSEASGDVSQIGYVKLERAHMLKWRGDLDGALALFEEAERILVGAGLTSFSLFARLNQGVVLAHQGHVQRAHQMLTDIINSLPPQMHQSTRSTICCIRLLTDAALQDWALWREDIAHLSQLPEVPDTDLAQILEAAGRWAEQHGRRAEAVRALTASGEIWRANQYPERARRVEEAAARLMSL